MGKRINQSGSASQDTVFSGKNPFAKKYFFKLTHKLTNDSRESGNDKYEEENSNPINMIK